ncbi:MAG: isoprenyl transferase [Thermoguttaceae bacterium]|nr:isoprenyl transferase [Thermoguttaceae bacterium]MDW8037639.1 isoprenyl transferase [Thermoguttaceae bacterium]
MNKPMEEDFDIPPNKRPRHIAAIMDGNGRWALRQGLPRIEGHRRGAEAVRRIVRECARLGIQQLTLFCFSSENWKRPPEELQFLMQLLEHYMVEERPELLENNIRLTVIGRREGLPSSAIQAMEETIRLTSQNTGLHLCLAINYGARQELTDAVRRIAQEVQSGRLRSEQIDEQIISQYLYTAGMPDPDLLIRTAGEMRLSNFLLWQCSYAELWVTERCWPEFDEELLRQAIRDYAARRRRFGGLLPEELAGSGPTVFQQRLGGNQHLGGSR